METQEKKNTGCSANTKEEMQKKQNKKGMTEKDETRAALYLDREPSYAFTSHLAFMH